MFRATHPVQLVLGLIVFSVWFVAMYGGMSLACELAPPPLRQGHFTWVNAALGVLTLATTAVLIFWTWLCWHQAPGPKDADRTGRFIARVSAGVHAISALSTLAVGLPVLALPPCI